MALTRLQNVISSVEGRILYVNPDDFDATDAIDNKGNSPIRPFKTLARAVLEVARYSYVSAGNADDKFDQFTIMLYPGDHIVDNRPGEYAYKLNQSGNYVAAIEDPFSPTPVLNEYGWSNATKQYADLYKIVNSTRGGLIIPRGVSIIGLDLRKTKIRPKYVPAGGTNFAKQELAINFLASDATPNQITITQVTGGDAGNVNDLIIGSKFEKGVAGGIAEGTQITDIDCNIGTGNITVTISKPHTYTGSGNQITGEIVKIPYEDDNSRSALFRITGGCYFWQFSIFDGDTAGVYTSSIVKPDTWSNTVDPYFSHTKLTIFEYASLHDLHTFYRKISDAVSIINCEKIEPKIQENRIVGPLADSVGIVKVVRNANTVTVTLAEELNLTAGNFISIRGGEGQVNQNFITGDGGTNPYYIGEKRISSVNNRSEFTYLLSGTDTSQLNQLESGLDEDLVTQSVQVTYVRTGSTESGQKTISNDAVVEIEIDTVESASPYIFNISLRSTYGTCGMHADGSRATGFKSMVVAQYTGISLQKDDEAFLKYDGTSYTQNFPSLHTDINAIYNPTKRSYHVKASNRAVIQAVSVFAVGYADHFIAEDGGDMSITNSNSNFGSNAMRSIGYSDISFKKDSLGKITHIIPPRNVESSDSNIYWETLDVELILNNSGTPTPTGNENERIYLEGRKQFLLITSPGSGFVSTTLTIPDTLLSLTVTLSADGAVTSASFVGDDYDTYQPGDQIHIPSESPTGLPLELVIGGSLTSFAGKYKIGERKLNKDGSTTADKIYVPLYLNAQTTTSEQYAEIDPAGNGNIFDWDFVNENWYVNVKPSANSIYQTIAANSTKYGTGKIETTPTSYIKRIVDERIDDDKIYRLRYVTKREDGTLPSFPQSGYVIQPKKGLGIPGVGDRFTDGANLLLTNKRFLANETVARYKSANPSFNIPNSNQACIDDLVNVIEAVAYNLRYGGNSEVYDAASLYLTGQPGGTGISGERAETVAMINTYLKPLVQYIINNGVTAAPVNTASIGSIVNTAGYSPVLIPYTLDGNSQAVSNEEQLINVPSGCTNVVNAANTLLDVFVDAVDNGAFNSTTRTTPSATYTRINGQEYNDVYYIYEVEEVVPYSYDADTGTEVEGVYYLTVLKGSVGVNTGVLPENNFKFSQETNDLYPVIDIDNIVSDPKIARSVADVITIGRVKTISGTETYANPEIAPINKSFSITKESVSSLLDEYLNNELDWTWSSKFTSSNKVFHKVTLNNFDGTRQEYDINLASTTGSGEVRKIAINPSREADGYAVELRRPSTIRSGNHTFEYVGFGPGNYSTGFPIRQTRVLSGEQQKYAQSLKEQGGIAFYSGLNSNGDLYIGNTVINAVTGKTTENQITELNTLTLKDNINVLGGAGNVITSTFQGPVSFLSQVTSENDAIFSNIQLRNQDGIISKFTNSDSIPNSQDGTTGDIVWNLQPEEGSNVGWMKTDDNVWRSFGLIGTDKVHAYKSGTNYVLNVGQDQIDISNNTSVNINYDLDVTTNQRVGDYLDIGTGATSAITSNSGNKETRLYIEQDWSTGGIDYKSIEVKLSNSGIGKYIDFLSPDGSSVFNVDVDGNVSIKEGSTYGLSDRAFAVRLSINSSLAASNDPGNSVITFEQATTTFGAGGEIIQYEGSAFNSNVQYTYGFRTKGSIQAFFSIGAPMDFDNFNPRSMLVFINGVLQTPYDDYYFDGNKIHVNQVPANNAKLEIRCLAN